MLLLLPLVATATPAPGEPNPVKETVRSYSPQLKGCYTERLKVTPGLEGRVEIGWSVAANQTSKVYVVNNNSGDDELAKCLVSKIEGWKFPDGVEGDISWPFVFKAKRDEDNKKK